ncbi:Wadjet anti-phage system protein JetD domain-containing protein [uncultured Corynebacterium sp.]|uniref:Wadjet anti-phage system protein JetD domain-containing protein n=1 Tax=uncultured Corynebacterium sp. TaxID=159447 RepID=UPI0025CCAE0F|nr:Wadjet anti-phage system protein JetD domain-containing protein [uncultured Corynebacterium sp.]
MARRSGPVPPAEAVAGLAATAEKRWKTWLVAPVQDASVDLPLHPPTGRTAAADVAGTSAWIRSWQAWETRHPAATMVWVEKSWTAAGLGRQRVPDRLQVTGVDALVALTGQGSVWRGLTRKFALLVGEDASASLREAAASVMSRWCDLTDEDLVRVHAVVDWFLSHPDSGLTPRAVPVEGVHGKWLERHLTLVTRLVVARRRGDGDDVEGDRTEGGRIEGGSVGGGDSAGAGASPLEFLGLVDREPLVRLRMPSGMPGWEGVPEDVTLTFSGAARLWADALSGGQGAVPVTGALMVENLESFLALPAAPGRVLLWGAGYSARKWAQLPWLAGLPVWYWGDLDADGFGILSAVRSHLPQVTSVLMNSDAVRRWRHLATEDAHPDRKHLGHLTAGESTARDLLASAGNLRIEQERILLAEAVDALTVAGFYGG